VSDRDARLSAGFRPSASRAIAAGTRRAGIPAANQPGLVRVGALHIDGRKNQDVAPARDAGRPGTATLIADDGRGEWSVVPTSVAVSNGNLPRPADASERPAG
jgi:hypothetical protein